MTTFGSILEEGTHTPPLFLGLPVAVNRTQWAFKIYKCLRMRLCPRGNVQLVSYRPDLRWFLHMGNIRRTKLEPFTCKRCESV